MVGSTSMALDPTNSSNLEQLALKGLTVFNPRRLKVHLRNGPCYLFQHSSSSSSSNLIALEFTSIAKSLYNG